MVHVLPIHYIHECLASMSCHVLTGTRNCQTSVTCGTVICNQMIYLAGLPTNENVNASFTYVPLMKSCTSGTMASPSSVAPLDAGL